MRKKLANNLRKIAAALRGMNLPSPTKPLEPSKTTMGPSGPPQMKQSLKGLPNPTETRSGE